MMKLGVELSLDHPCSEDWALMTPVDRGRFCDACQKTVVDMTSWTERDFVEYFNAQPGGTCGRFLEHQLNHRFNYEPVAKKRTPAYRKAAALVLSLFALQPAAAQHRTGSATVQSPPASRPGADVRIWGTVMDADSVPLEHVHIAFNGKSCTSSAGGDFELMIPAAELRAGILIFSYDGFPSQVRNYNPVMQSTRYDVRMQKPSGSRGHGGAPVVRFFLPEDGPNNYVSVPADVLDDQTKAVLANIAAMMMASPASRIALQACSGKDPKPGIRRAIAIRNYLSDRMYVDSTRILIPKPKRTRSAAERNRVYFQSWDDR